MVWGWPLQSIKFKKILWRDQLCSLNPKPYSDLFINSIYCVKSFVRIVITHQQLSNESRIKLRGEIQTQHEMIHRFIRHTSTILSSVHLNPYTRCPRKNVRLYAELPSSKQTFFLQQELLWSQNWTKWHVLYQKM